MNRNEQVVSEDVDGDGVLGNDQCPCFAEDRDGFEDEDGCPDLDNDRDRYPDVCDECPNDPEVFNGTEDEDGCPDEGRPEPVESVSRVARHPFAAGASELSDDQRGSLYELIGRVIYDSRRAASVHAEAAMGDENAAALADARAEAARAYLAARGVRTGQIRLSTSVGREDALTLEVIQPIAPAPLRTCRPPALVSRCEGPSVEQFDDRCPNLLEDHDGFEDDDGCPDTDNDGDAIPDDQDECPCEPEDMDGWRDEDGCPEPDNDGDHVADVCDSCPLEPETWNGMDDEDGCPERQIVRVDDHRIQILESLFFSANATTIRDRDLVVVDRLAALLVDHPELALIAIDGQSSRGEPGPMALSQARAEAVRDALVTRGVNAARLDVRSLGTSQPRSGGREQNRRVSFEVLDVAGRPPPPALTEGELLCRGQFYAVPLPVCVLERVVHQARTSARARDNHERV